MMKNVFPRREAELLDRAKSAEARVRELEATDRIPADVEKRNTWAKRIVDERDAAQEAAGSAERRLGELEAEMKECSEVRAKLAVELAEYQLRQPALEAQCAAMREALDEALKFVAVTPWTNKAPWTDDRLNRLFEDGQASLSGDAGRALLERVEAQDRRIAALESVAKAAREFRDAVAPMDYDAAAKALDYHLDALSYLDALEPKR